MAAEREPPLIEGEAVTVVATVAEVRADGRPVLVRILSHVFERGSSSQVVAVHHSVVKRCR